MPRLWGEVLMEPILVGLSPAAIAAAVGILVNFGKAWFGLQVSPEQVDSLNQLLIWLIPLLGAIGAWWARRNSTPTASPTLPEGTQVTVVTPGDAPNRTTTL